MKLSIIKEEKIVIFFDTHAHTHAQTRTHERADNQKHTNLHAHACVRNTLVRNFPRAETFTGRYFRVNLFSRIAKFCIWKE